MPIAAGEAERPGDDVVRVIDLDDGGKVTEVPVETGLTEGSFIEITSGSEGRRGRDRRGRHTGDVTVTHDRRSSSSSGVSRAYGEEVKVHALRDVSLTIGAGDFMSIVGPSGSGKSTMLGLLGCLDLPTTGSIRIGGVDVTTLDDADRSKLRGDSIGFVFQQFHLIPHLTALGNVETALLYRGHAARRSAATGRCTRSNRSGSAARADHRPVQMSGGEQQRVAIARAIVTDPLMVLADEPTGALDTTNAANVLGDLPRPAVARARGRDRHARPRRRRRRANAAVSMRDGEIVADERRSVRWPHEERREICSASRGRASRRATCARS